MERRPFRVNPQILAFARSMRHGPAPAEQKLWQCLRNRSLGGFKFRRQHPVGSHVPDFYCAECKLIVELDGDSHFEPDAEEKDARRAEKLTEDGCSVVRFTNVDVFENPDGVLEAILEKCEKRREPTLGPSPYPSPLNTGERGRGSTTDVLP